MLTKALVPLNFRESVQKVTDMCQFIRSLGTERVVLLHVGTERGRAGKNNRNRLLEYAGEIQPLGLYTDTVVRAGSVQEQIENCADEFDADFISIPFKKKSWLSRVILGSNVKDVIRLSDKPIFVYKVPGFRQRNDEVFRVLYATSLQGRDDIIISYIRKESFQLDEITFIYVGRRAPDPFVEKQRRDTVEKSLHELGEKCGLGRDESSYIQVIGSPRKEIVKEARRLPADLVLMGKADTGSSSEPVLGSTAEEVSYNAPCSVLLVPKNVDFKFHRDAQQ